MSRERTRVQDQPAWLLHHRPWRETSIIADLLTRDFGRTGVIARGVRTARSRRGAELKLFQPLLVGWTGRGDLPTLTGVEVAGAALVLAGANLASGFYVNELVVRTIQQGEPVPTLFQAYCEAMAGLASAEPPGPHLRYFELGLLETLGYEIDLTRVDGGAAVTADAHYRYDAQGGLEHASRAVAGETVSGATLLALAQRRLAAERDCWSEARRLLNGALAPVLGERPLRSRELLR